MRGVPAFIDFGIFPGDDRFFAQETFRKEPALVGRVGLGADQRHTPALIVFANCFTCACPCNTCADNEIIPLNHFRNVTIEKPPRGWLGKDESPFAGLCRKVKTIASLQRANRRGELCEPGRSETWRRRAWPSRIIKAPHGKSRLKRSHPRDPPAVPPGWHAGSVLRQPIQSKPQRRKMLSPCFRKWSRR